MKITEAAYSTIFNKCPRCHKGDVFVEKNPYVLNKLFSLHERCANCQLRYEKEPSFFYGAMYISYALTAGWFILWYLLYLSLFDNFNTFLFASLLGLSILVLSPLTLRLSRLLWLNLFFKFDKHYKIKQEETINKNVTAF